MKRQSSLTLIVLCFATMSTLSRSFAVRSVGLLSGSFLSSVRSKAAFATTALKMTATDTLILDNPLLKRDHLPLFNEIEPKHVTSAVLNDLAKLKTDFADFEGKLTLTSDYATVIEQLEKIQAPLSYSWSVVGHLMGVKNSDALRTAHDEVQPSVIEIMQKLGQSQNLFQSLTSLKSRDAVWSTLDEPQQRIIASSIQKMEALGVGLNEGQKEEFNKLQLEQAELSTKFSNNVLDATKAFKLKIDLKSEIEGLPSSAVEYASKQAVSNGHTESTPELGPWIFTLDMPSYLPCLQYLKNRRIRKILYREFITRASTESRDNAPIIKRILQIKKLTSKMLGYESFAEKSLKQKMALKIESVMKLTEMLREKALPVARVEMADLEVFAQNNGFLENLRAEKDDNEKFSLWDVAYWSEKMREQKYMFEEEELRAYFPLKKVLEGLFALSERLFGVRVEEMKYEDSGAEVQKWCDDVIYFKITDIEKNEHIANFFLDPFSRPAEKRGGAWMDVCVGKSQVMDKKPVAYLVCNMSPPVGDKPSLMTFREVETLFHEFGHGLQHMLTRVTHGDAAGINNVEWDAVELPSQFMENWCYDKPTLYGFAKHYLTGEPLPLELFEKMKEAKNYQAGLGMLRQLYFGAMDIELHSPNYDPFGDKTIFDLQHEMADKYAVIPPLADDRFLCSFGHIFAGGYSAGYYSYKWAEVMSADCFAAFEEVGLDNEEAVRATGKRFRETVLAMGGGKHPSDVYKAFRGRDPDPAALLRHTGLTK